MPESGLEILGKKPGNWDVLLSQKALKQIQNLARSGNFKPVEEKLRDLAAGSWQFSLAGSPYQHKKLRVPLAITQCTPQIQILWQIDVTFSDTAQSESQLVKVWEISSRADVSQSIDRVILLQSSYTAQRTQRCRRRPHVDKDRKSVPVIYSDEQDAAGNSEPAEILDIRTADREVVEMANRFYTLTENMLCLVLAHDLQAEFPFQLSSDETRVILHLSTSSLLLGRSGTGKTTCLVFKLLAKYVAGSAEGNERLPRQLLLTRSNELASKLNDYIKRLIRTLAAPSLGSDEQDDHPLLPRADDDDDNDDENEDEDEDRQTTVFDLQTHSFPLVCTFNQFLKVLENTINRTGERGFSNDEYDAGARRNEDQDCLESSEDEYPHQHQPGIRQLSHFVDFQSFKLEYWPKLSPARAEKFPAELVFAEIMGVIKGSLSSRKSLKPLPREDYVQLSSRLAPSFSLEAEKSRVYDLFEKYQALKLHRRELDDVDRVIQVIKVVRENQQLRSCLGAMLDEIYIDEVQDMRCLEIELLLNIVKDGRAFHFAGDTAQTISQDSQFRFQDIKALFYDHFNTEASLTNQPELSRPRLFMLGKNYRSHQGILSLASLVMDMLWNLFPDMVDKLEPEVGQIHGPKPVFFLGCSSQMLAWSGNDSTDQPQHTIDFGAEQAIIVRDLETKARLQSELENTALILTILQSKGMEFEDVFLWDFFTRTPCPGGWRSLIISPEKFDTTKYSGMCSEFKQFYVAVTRARIRVSIIESEDSPAKEIITLLNRETPSPLVEVTKSSDPDFLKELISLRSVSYDPARWSGRGRELMQRKQYDDALICFRKAKDKRGEAHASAYIAEENGTRQKSVAANESAVSYFREAAEIFMKLDLIADASRNLERMGAFRKAAELWLKKKKYLKAAQLLEKAGLFERAAEIYHAASAYDKAANALQNGNLADPLVSYVTENQRNLSSECYRRHSRSCAILLKQERLLQSSLVPAIKLLGKPEDQERAFITYGMQDQLKHLYLEQRNVKMLFKMQFKAGDLADALDVLEDVHLDPDDSISRAVQRTYDHLIAGAIFNGEKNSAHEISSTFRKPVPKAAQTVLQRIPDWTKAFEIAVKKPALEAFTACEHLGGGIVKHFLQLHLLINRSPIDNLGKIKEFPFQTIQAGIRIAKEISSLGKSCLHTPSLLLAGVLEIDRKANHFILLSWSPIRNTASKMRSEEFPLAANEWLLEKLASSMLSLDLKLRNLWRLEWPSRCAMYLTSKSCRKFQNGECLFDHKSLSEADVAVKTSMLVKINTVFCELSSLYYKFVMGEEFQSSILGIRRHWLEILIEELTFISSVVRCSRVISQACSDLLIENRAHEAQLPIASHLEGLLFHRLGREWVERKDLSSLLEQIQLSQIFDFRIQKRFSMAFYHKLRWTPDSNLQLHMTTGLIYLENELNRPDAACFHRNLDKFSAAIQNSDVRHLASFHAITTVFEFFALYLMLRTCRLGIVLPQSWIDIHMPRILGNGQTYSASSVPANSRPKYRSSLANVIHFFAMLLSRLDPYAVPEVAKGFRFGKRTYPSRLLHRRNVELLSIANINLRTAGTYSPDLDAASKHISRLFELRFLYASHLRHNSAHELIEKLVRSYDMYDGKDAIKYLKINEGYNELEQKLQKMKVQTIRLSDITPKVSGSQNLSQAYLPKTNEPEEYDKIHKNAIQRIQRFWRRMLPRVQEERNLQKTSHGQFILQLRATNRKQHHHISKQILDLLVSRGFRIHKKHQTQTAAATELQQRAVILASSDLPLRRLEPIGDVIEGVEGALKRLDEAEDSISVSKLLELALEEKDMVEEKLGEVDAVMQDVEKTLMKGRKLLETVV